MTLIELIEQLEQQDATLQVQDGFGEPHSDRGDYSNVAFVPVERTTFGEMLVHARSALGATFTGWKGGEYTMHEYVDAHIGEYGDCGEEITPTHFKYWLLTAHRAEYGKGILDLYRRII